MPLQSSLFSAQSIKTHFLNKCLPFNKQIFSSLSTFTMYQTIMQPKRFSEGKFALLHFVASVSKATLAPTSFSTAWEVEKLPHPEPETPWVHFLHHRLAQELQILWQGVSRCHRARTTAHTTDGHWGTSAAKLAHELTHQQQLCCEGAGKAGKGKGWEKKYSSEFQKQILLCF